MKQLLVDNIAFVPWTVHQTKVKSSTLEDPTRYGCTPSADFVSLGIQNLAFWVYVVYLFHLLIGLSCSVFDGVVQPPPPTPKEVAPSQKHRLCDGFGTNFLSRNPGHDSEFDVLRDHFPKILIMMIYYGMFSGDTTGDRCRISVVLSLKNRFPGRWTDSPIYWYPVWFYTFPIFSFKVVGSLRPV